jgi:hypothetical protein
MQVRGQCHALVALGLGKDPSVIHRTGGWLDPKSGLDPSEGRKSLAQLEIEPRLFSRPHSSLVTEQSKCNSFCTGRSQFLSFIQVTE